METHPNSNEFNLVERNSGIFREKCIDKKKIMVINNKCGNVEGYMYSEKKCIIACCPFTA